MDTLGHARPGSERPDSDGTRDGRPALKAARLLPQAAVIGCLVASVLAYIPAGQTVAMSFDDPMAFQTGEREISIVVNGESRTVRTRTVTVGQLLKELGYEGHAIASVPEDTSLDRITEPLVIDLAREVTIVSGSQTFQIYTRAVTVRELLTATGLKIHTELSAKKGVELSTQIYDGMTVYVRELRLPLTVTEEEQIPYSSQQFVDTTMAPGARRVIRSGKVGEKVRTYRIEATKDGSLRRVLVNTKTVRKPEAEQVAVGPSDPGSSRDDSIPTLAGSSSPSPMTPGRDGWNFATDPSHPATIPPLAAAASPSSEAPAPTAGPYLPQATETASPALPAPVLPGTTTPPVSTTPTQPTLPLPTVPSMPGPAPTTPAPTSPAPTSPAPTSPAPSSPAPSSPAPTDSATPSTAPSSPAPESSAPAPTPTQSSTDGGALAPDPAASESVQLTPTPTSTETASPTSSASPGSTPEDTTAPTTEPVQSPAP